MYKLQKREGIGCRLLAQDLAEARHRIVTELGETLTPWKITRATGQEMVIRANIISIFFWIYPVFLDMISNAN